MKINAKVIALGLLSVSSCALPPTELPRFSHFTKPDETLSLIIRETPFSGNSKHGLLTNQVSCKLKFEQERVDEKKPGDVLKVGDRVNVDRVEVWAGRFFEKTFVVASYNNSTFRLTADIVGKELPWRLSDGTFAGNTRLAVESFMTCLNSSPLVKLEGR